MPEETGLYSPEDSLWRIHRELLIVFSGSRALLMELAHPLVAAGVAQHSDFRRAPFGRLFRTVRMMQRLSFGSDRAARKSARQVNQCHAPVHGTLAYGEGAFHGGTHYDANDPALRLWVFATSIDSILATHDHFVRPLSFAQKEAYYADSIRMARMLGVPPSHIPADYAAFQAYVQTMLTDGTLSVGPTALAIMEGLFDYPLIGGLLRLASAPGMGLLPESLRDGFKISWTAADQRRLDRLGALCRKARATLPEIVWLQPEAWIGEVRWRLAGSRS